MNAATLKRELLESAPTINITPQLAKYFDLGPDDLLFKVDDDRYQRWGIGAGDVLLLRLLWDGARPQDGEITLIIVEGHDGRRASTLLPWLGEAFEELPPNVRAVWPVAVCRGRIEGDGIEGNQSTLIGL
jgi:hypothetical protein